MTTTFSVLASAPRFVLGATAIVALVAASGCPPVEPEPEGPGFSVFAEDVEGGAILGAHIDRDTLIFVGGDVDGSTGSIFRYTADGALCHDAEALRGTLWWIHGVTDGEWYAVGDRGLIVHEVDGQRTDESVATEATLYGVFVADDRVIAVGGDVRGTGLGEVWVRDRAPGSPWTLLHGDVAGVLFKVWSTWIVGQASGYRLDADDALVAQTLPIEGEPDLLTIVGRDEEDVFAVGGGAGALMLQHDNGVWSDVEVDVRCTFQPLNGVWTAPGEDVYVAGFAGGIGRFDGTEWQCPPDRITSRDFHVVKKFGDDVFFAGGNLFQPSGNRAVIARFGDDASQAGAVTTCD